jgi:hypothetical protein
MIFLVSIGEDSAFAPPRRLVDEREYLTVCGKLFAPGGALDWVPQLPLLRLRGYEQVHHGYFDKALLERYRVSSTTVLQCLERWGVHGFSAREDRQLVEDLAYQIALERLRSQGHDPVLVADQQHLGYDMQCGHCAKVFEIKGMTSPNDIELTSSEVSAAEQRAGDYVLICVHGLPNPNYTYTEIPNPKRIWTSFSAKITRQAWQCDFTETEPHCGR